MSKNWKMGVESLRDSECVRLLDSDESEKYYCLPRISRKQMKGTELRLALADVIKQVIVYGCRLCPLMLLVV
jgi:hypothetical protein